MKYCTRCKRLFLKQEHEVCPYCRKKTIDSPNPSSPVRIITANGFELERICAALSSGEIPYSYQQIRKDTGLQILNSAPPENCDIYVPMSDYYNALEILAGIGAAHEDELDAAESSSDELKKIKASAPPDELSPGKARLVRILSLIAFFLVLTGAIYLTDALTGFIKRLFGA